MDQSISDDRDSDGQSHLTLRYHMQVLFTELDDEEHWDAISSFHTPLEALYGCSECLESVKDLLGISMGSEIQQSYVQFRVWDSDDLRMIFWEDQNGGVCWDDVVFENCSHRDDGSLSGGWSIPGTPAG